MLDSDGFGYLCGFCVLVGLVGHPWHIRTLALLHRPSSRRPANLLRLPHLPTRTSLASPRSTPMAVRHWHINGGKAECESLVDRLTLQRYYESVGGSPHRAALDLRHECFKLNIYLGYCRGPYSPVGGNLDNCNYILDKSA